MFVQHDCVLIVMFWDTVECRLSKPYDLYDFICDLHDFSYDLYDFIYDLYDFIYDLYDFDFHAPLFVSLIRYTLHFLEKRSQIYTGINIYILYDIKSDIFY